MLMSDSNCSETDTIINPFLREYYELPEDGSFLVLAKKLSDRKAFRVPITTGSLPYQLMDCTSYCNHPQDFEGLKKKLKGESIIMNESFIETLLKLLSLTSPSSRLDKYASCWSPQHEMARNAINEEKQKIIDVSKPFSNDEDLTDRVLRLYNLIEHVFVNVLNEVRYVNDNVRRCTNYSMLAKKSKRFWNTYERLTRVIEEWDRDELDYSAFILYLGKIVETELNLSVCQMLRQAMGIEMPEYYNKYHPSIGDIFIPTQNNFNTQQIKNIHLNNFYRRCGQRKLKGVALGDLLHAYKTAVGLECSPDWYIPENIEEIPEDFLEIWYDLIPKRNNAAHSLEVDADSFEETEGLFNQFLIRFMPELSEMKNRLATWR